MPGRARGHNELAFFILSLALPCLECTFTNVGRLQGLYLGWLGRANLGDELVLDIFGHLLRDSLLQPGMFKHVHLEYQQPFSIRRPRAVNYSSYNFAVLGGGSLLESVRNPRTEQCDGVGAAKLPVYVHGTGTQLPHNEYDARNLRCLEPPVWGGVRGPLTNDLLANMSGHYNMGAAKYQLPVFGDSGILAGRIFPRFSTQTVRDLDKAVQSSSDPVLCVSGALRFGQPRTSNFIDTAALVESWAQKYIVVLLPVDPSTAKHQELMYQEALSSKRVAEGRLFFNTHISHYSIWLALLSRCSLLVSNRLHAAVMASAAGTPFVMPYEKAIPLKAQDFLMGTVGAEMWREFFVRHDEFDGSLAAVAALLRQARSRHARQRAAFNRAIAHAYPLYASSLKQFVDKIIPDSYKSFTDVLIKIDRHRDIALIDLVFG